MIKDTNEDKLYKLNQMSIRKQISRDIEENIEKFKDPIVLGELVYRLLEERENTNRILKNLLTKLEALETAIGKKQIEDIDEPLLLPEVDKLIVSFLEQGPKTAEEVQIKFKYKGKNAACARLNRLYDLGIVTKKHVGKNVFFILKQGEKIKGR